MKNINRYIIEKLTKALYDFMNTLNSSHRIIFATDEIKNEYQLKELEISQSNDEKYIILNKIIIQNKGNGLGTKFMRDFCMWADENKKIVCLTPDDSFGATSVSRLKKFYRRFGFVENKGKYSDFNHKESMYRKPKQ